MERAEPHHVKTRGAGGGDEWCIPLCRIHHAEIHNTGRLTFTTRRKIDLPLTAKAYALGSPDPKIRAAAKDIK